MMDEVQELIPVEGHTHLGRDPHSNAIVNMDKQGYQAYIQARNRNSRKEEEITELRAEIDELKSMMRELLEKNK